MRRIINVGSINLDHVYKVPHFVRPGETLASTSYSVGFGGKGFNQSVALARAGVNVLHAGAVGPDAGGLVQRLQDEGVGVDRICKVDEPTGHAIIQVNQEGQNSIVLYPGANATLSSADFTGFFEGLGPGDHCLCQNETTAVSEALEEAKQRGLTIWFNPAPMSPNVLEYPLDAVDWLIVNETEGQMLSNASAPEEIISTLKQRWPHLNLVLTLGGEGVVLAARNPGQLHVPASKVTVVDTTAAGDTFIGYLIAGIIDEMPLEAAAKRAVRAAGISVSRPGAADSVPFLNEL